MDQTPESAKMHTQRNARGSYEKYGPKSKKNANGCDVSTCTEFHPKICPSSLKKGECSASKCPFSHLKGTKKSQPSQQMEVWDQHTQSVSHTMNNVKAKGSQMSQIPIENTFLDLATTLTEKVNQLMTRLMTLEARAPMTQVHSQCQLQLPRM